MRFTFTLSLLVVATPSWCEAQDTAPERIDPVSFARVKLDDAFWAPRIETNRAVSIPHAFAKCEENGRMHNFALAGGTVQGAHRGIYPFDDTDVYKVLEGAAYALAVRPDAELESYLDELAELIAGAQEEDGYLFTCRTNGWKELERWAGKERWASLYMSHELYNAGHFFEAAVAHWEATGKRTLLEVAIRLADMLDRAFGPGALRRAPGHQIVEMGLARLYRATGEERYLHLAKFFLDVRGRPLDGRELFGPYSQDHMPVLEQREAVGHAVRATYMYAGMADVAALSGDLEYAEACDRIWENVVQRKLYLTGGVGARHAGEAFGDDYELPNESAYCETCAAIGNVYWNHRLFMRHGDARHIDVLERTLYNALLSGVSLDGTRFFYQNPLASHGDHERSEWFGCACCPGNVTRFIASVPGYLYVTRGDALYANLFAAGEAELELAGTALRIRQQTRYPWDGAVEFTIDPERETAFALHLRIPGWAREEPVPSELYRFAAPRAAAPTLSLNGEPLELELTRGYARLERTWKSGDTLRLELPMPVRRVHCREQVAANRGRVALQRGPLVYCAEWPDNPGGHVQNLLLPDSAELAVRHRPDLLGGITCLEGTALTLSEGADGAVIAKRQPFAAIPYHAWAHRGKGEMAVWLPHRIDAATPLPAPTIASQSEVRVSFGKNPRAMNDLRVPRSSGDHGVPFFHWWPHKGSAEWVEYHFAGPQRIAAVQLYWFDDTGRGECRLPASWRLLYRAGDKWHPVSALDPYGCAGDTFNRVRFALVETDALRLEVQLPEGFAAGIHEWVVAAAR